MEFCILSPIAGLERYSTLSKTHLLLPQLDKVKGYRDFYLKRRDVGDFLILDNGAYEGQTDWQHLVECIKIYKPQVVALPDYMSQPWDKTYWEAQRFLDSYYDQFPWVKWMFIPQAVQGDIVCWTVGLELMMRDERVTWVGLARVLTYETTQDLEMRYNAARTIHKLWPHIKIHALGMAKGSVQELSWLRSLGYVNSIDSNAPVWRGWCGYDLVNGRWDETPCNYEVTSPAMFSNVTSDFEAYNHHGLILNNLEACGVDTTNSRSRNNPQRKATSGG